jgi:hypothetical protein
MIRRNNSANTLAPDPLPFVPKMLKEIPNWVSWKLVDGDKPPLIAGTDKHASSTDPSTWTDYQTAVTKTTINGVEGVGFVLGGLTLEKKILGVDIDGCYDPNTDTLTPWAEKIVDLLGCYTERTPSGLGLRIWVVGEWPFKEHKFNLSKEAGHGDKVGIEIYDVGRYFTVTGDAWYEEAANALIEPRDLSSLHNLCLEIQTKHPRVSKSKINSTSTSTEGLKIEHEGSVITDKYELLMRGSISGDKPLIITDGLGNSLTYDDRSAADLALCTVSALKHGDNEDAIWEDYTKSSLFRPKWEKREDDFRRLTIANGIATAKRMNTQTAGSASSNPQEGTASNPIDAIGKTENGIPIFPYPKSEDESFEDVLSITDLEGKGDVTVEYPDPGTDDLVSLFAFQLASGTSLPLAYIRETLKNLTNQLIDGYLIHPVYPTLSLRGFHFNYGASWVGKTSAFDLVLGWMKADFEKRGIWMRDLLSYGSRQFFVRMLSREVPLDKDGKPKWKEGNPLQFLHVKEGNRIAADVADKHFKGIFSILVDLYDQGEASTGSFSNDEWRARDVKVGSIINITPTDFRTTFQGKGSVGSGGLPRWTIAAPPKVENKKDWTRMPQEKLWATFELLRARLPIVAEKMLASEQSIVTTGPIVLTEEEGAKEVRLATHNRMEEAGKMGVRLSEYFVREQVNRAAFSVHSPNVMTAADAEKIALWTDAQLKARAIWPPDAGNPVECHEVTIRRTVIRHLVTETKLKDACHYYRPGSGGVWAFNTALANMLKDDIKCVGVSGQRRTPVFCPRWCKDHPRIKI